MSQTLMYVCTCVNCLKFDAMHSQQSDCPKLENFEIQHFLKNTNSIVKFQITLHSSEIRGLRSMKMSRRPLFYFLAGHSNRNFLIHEKLRPPVTLFT